MIKNCPGYIVRLKILLKNNSNYDNYSKKIKNSESFKFQTLQEQVSMKIENSNQKYYSHIRVLVQKLIYRF